MQPPIPYFGSKASIANQIVALLPPHNAYIEPYGGSLCVLLAKPPILQEVVNDLNQEIVNFWRVLRERPNELERLAALTPHSRAEYLTQAHNHPTDPLNGAWATWVRLTQSISSGTKPNGWRTYRQAAGHGSLAKQHLPAYCRRIAPAAVRLAGVTLECRPALDVISDYGTDPNALVYLDPPYYPTTVTEDRYGCHMTADEHTKMLDAAKQTAAQVAISGYRCPIYDQALADWHRTDIITRTGNANLGRRSPTRTESVWTNYPPPRWTQPSLDFTATHKE
jgi:DNA adenine methylase